MVAAALKSTTLHHWQRSWRKESNARQFKGPGVAVHDPDGILVQRTSKSL
jgi:hypothetical protein